MTREEEIRESILKDIRQRERAATKGPWSIGDKHGKSIWANEIDDFIAMNCKRVKDTIFMTRARADIPYLLNEVDRLAAELEKKNTPLTVDKSIMEHAAWSTNWYNCPHCGVSEITSTFKFCPNCGKPLNWGEKNFGPCSGCKHGDDRFDDPCSSPIPCRNHDQYEYKK